jgi:hypothetical protein
MTFTPEQIEARYQKLPEVVKKALYDVETTDLVMAIGKKNNLHIDQIGELAREVGLLMIGLETPEQFSFNLAGTLHLTEAQAASITAEVNEKIVLKVRALMRGEDFSQASNAVPTNLPDREEVLREIENPTPIAHTTPVPPAASTKPAPAPTPATDIFAAKMSQMFSLPRTETEAPAEKSADPYREPLS